MILAHLSKSYLQTFGGYCATSKTNGHLYKTCYECKGHVQGTQSRRIKQYVTLFHIMSLLISYNVKLNVPVKIGCFCVSRKLASGTEMPEKMPNKICFNSDFCRGEKTRRDRPLIGKVQQREFWGGLLFSDKVKSSSQEMDWVIVHQELRCFERHLQVPEYNLKLSRLYEIILVNEPLIAEWMV